MGERAHRCQHVAGGQAVAVQLEPLRPRSPRGQLAQQRLAVDVEEREADQVGEPPAGSGSPWICASGIRRGTRRICSLKRAAAASSRPARLRATRAAARPRRPARLETCHATVFALIAGRGAPSGCRCGRPANPRRPGRPTCARWRDSSAAPARRSRPARGRRDCAASTCSGTPAAGRAPRPRRGLAGADLVVGGLHAGQRDPRTRSADTSLEVDPAPPVDADRRLRPPAASWASAACRTQECSMAVVTSRRPAGPRPASPPRDGQVRRGRAAGGEADLVRPGPEHRRDRLAGRVEQQPGLPASPYSRVGSAQPSSSAASRASRAAGCKRCAGGRIEIHQRGLGNRAA